MGECISSGESWVAIDEKGRVTGFLLVEPDKLERFHRDNQALHVRYAGVAKSQRKRGVFRALIQLAKSRKAPLTVTVKVDNQSEMAARLTRTGFQKWGVGSHLEENFRWQP